MACLQVLPAAELPRDYRGILFVPLKEARFQTGHKMAGKAEWMRARERGKGTR